MKYLKLFTDFAAKMEYLSEAERGRLFTAMLEYAETGIAPELKGNERFIFSAVKTDIDAQRRSYDAKVEGMAKTRQIGADIRANLAQSNRLSQISGEEKKRKDQDQEKKKRESTKEKSAASRFTPPTVEEVADYCRERENNVDAGMFVDFYASKGWKVGKETMVDWKACVRTWERGHDDGKRRNQSRNVDREQAQSSDEKWGITYSA